MLKNITNKTQLVKNITNKNTLQHSKAWDPASPNDVCMQPHSSIKFKIIKTAFIHFGPRCVRFPVIFPEFLNPPPVFSKIPKQALIINVHAYIFNTTIQNLNNKCKSLFYS